jgi:hypothetical protein
MTESAGSERSSPSSAARHGAHPVVFFAFAVTCGSVFAPGAQLYAQPPSTLTRELDAIIVTARIREERSQDVPFQSLP